MAEQKRRSQIHYGIFLGIGLMMIILSTLVLLQGTSQYPASMKLFRWVGIGFTIIGVGKLLFKLYDQGKIGGGEKKTAEKLAGIPQPQQNQSTAHARGAPVTIVACSRCGVKNHSTSNYCHMCGRPLQKV